MTSIANLAVLALLGCTSALSNNVQTVHAQSAENTWDYVIVGGGITGLVVANRLTEETKKSVLVIEAGAADDNPSIRVPYVAALPINGSLLWDLKSVPEPHIANRTFVPKVAKALGGGSIVNGMMYDRAAAADYDAWEALGNKGWGWKGLYPYFKKSTELIEPPAEVAEKFGITWDAEAYGKGPLKIGITEFQYPDLKHFFQAFQRAGAHAARSGDNGEAYGTAWFPNTMNPLTSERSHARNSYYEPASKRSNLKIMLETLATEIIFDGKMLTAKGVKITNRRTNSSSAVYARKEVILAAGAIKTPQLLQLSGIGPRSVLEAAGIPVKLEHDGVGANFQDHPYTSMAFNTSNMSEPNPTSWNDPEFNSSAWEQYAENKTGPLTMARGNSLAFIPLQDVDPERYSSLANQVRSPNNNDFLPSIYKNSKKLLKGFHAQRNILATLYESGKAGVVEFPIVASGAFELVGLEKPVSRGTIMIDPTDPQGSPKVFYNSFSNPIRQY